MKNNKSLIRKINLFLNIQTALLGENNKNLKINPLEFATFLTKDKKRIPKEKYIKNEKYLSQDFQSIYNSPIDSKELRTYEYKDGKTKQISGPKLEREPRDYIFQKLMAIKTLSEQIKNKEI